MSKSKNSVGAKSDPRGSTFWHLEIEQGKEVQDETSPGALIYKNETTNNVVLMTRGTINRDANWPP